MAVSLVDLRSRTVEAALLSAEEIGAFESSLPQPPTDGETLARELVRAKKLTAYQAQALLQNKAKSLVLGNYMVVDKLGQGGMGMVLKAEHRRMKRVVALKVLSPNLTRTGPKRLQPPGRRRRLDVSRRLASAPAPSRGT